MIRVTIEVIPFGIENHPRKREIGRMEIANDGSGTLTKGNYNIKVFRKGNYNKVQREGRVENHSKKTKSIWSLLLKALKELKY